MYNFNSWWPGIAGMGFVFMAFFWIIVIWLIVALVRSAFGHDHGYHRHHGWEDGDRALDILKERYAKGEIDKQEFEEKKKDLEK